MFLTEGLNNGFKASLYPVDFVAACYMRSDGPGGGFCSATKKMETKVLQKAEMVFKEKKWERKKGRCHQTFTYERCVSNLGRFYNFQNLSKIITCASKSQR